MSLLTKLHDRGLIVPRNKETAACPRNDKEWLNEAIASHERQNLYGIISRKASIDARPNCPACTTSIEDVLLNPLWNGRQQSRRVPRTASGFEAALTPVLGTARSVMLIDPYIAFRVHRGNVEFLEMLEVVDRCLMPDNRRCPLSLIEIHTVDAPEIANDAYPKIIEKIKRAMPKLRSSNATFTFMAWQERPNGLRFHNRRILTNHAAISCPWGLDIHDQPKNIAGEDEWSLLEENVRDAIWQEFQQNTSPYDLKQKLSWRE
jgi:hypothetical protein